MMKHLFNECLEAIVSTNIVHLKNLVMSNVGVLKCRDPQQRTLLLNACFPMFSRAESVVIRCLLSLGASPFDVDYMGLTCLHGIVMMHTKQHPQPVADIASALVDAGLEVDARDSYGNTPLWRALMTWEPEQGFGKIDALIALGASLDVKNKTDSSPRDLAASIDGYEAIAAHLGVARKSGDW